MNIVDVVYSFCVVKYEIADWGNIFVYDGWECVSEGVGDGVGYVIIMNNILQFQTFYIFIHEGYHQ